jgi:peptide chain release factor subunit 1
MYLMKSSPTGPAFDTLTPITEIDLHSLSQVGDEEDNFLSIYLPKDSRDGRAIVMSRLKMMGKALPKDLEEIFAGTVRMAEPALSAPRLEKEKGRIIFASSPQGFLAAFRVGVDLEPLVVWDSSPFLLPLSRLRRDYEDYGLLLIDSREARLFLVRSRAVEEKEKRSIDLMNKHKKGGWSQMRFNRLRRGAIKSFLTQVVEDLKDLDHEEIKGLVVAGPGEAKGQLVRMLPALWKSKVLGVLEVSMQTPDGALMKLGNEVITSERSKEKELAEKLKEAVLKGRPVAYGLADVGEALKQGRVNHLLLSNSFALPQMICKKCSYHGHAESCPTCGAEMKALGLEELYQQAERTGAEIVLVEEDAFLESIGGIGSILRY